MASNWCVCICRVGKKRLQVLLLCDWAEKNKDFLAPIRIQWWVGGWEEMA